VPTIRFVEDYLMHQSWAVIDNKQSKLTYEVPSLSLSLFLSVYLPACLSRYPSQVDNILVAFYTIEVVCSKVSVKF